MPAPNFGGGMMFPQGPTAQQRLDSSLAGMKNGDQAQDNNGVPSPAGTPFGMTNQEQGMLGDARTAQMDATTAGIQNGQFNQNPGAYTTEPQWKVLLDSLRGMKMKGSANTPGIADDPTSTWNTQPANPLLSKAPGTS